MSTGPSAESASKTFSSSTTCTTTDFPDFPTFASGPCASVNNVDAPITSGPTIDDADISTRRGWADVKQANTTDAAQTEGTDLYLIDPPSIFLPAGHDVHTETIASLHQGSLGESDMPGLADVNQATPTDTAQTEGTDLQPFIDPPSTSSPARHDVHTQIIASLHQGTPGESDIPDPFIDAFRLALNVAMRSWVITSHREATVKDDGTSSGEETDIDGSEQSSDELPSLQATPPLTPDDEIIWPTSLSRRIPTDAYSDVDSYYDGLTR
ncbi:uncharacterized protein ARMOST_22192 [Armillaria ostoyae]|uniref:Uncharacterized protein n=1 Tax=Armillaria ostoyae TaxID=47428 RepID=A0A284SC68_ARMOS|nr:uncharacterized protein ARMOST_22192 [Armillaria ostoyae]